jgi:hypothetical protein
MVLLFLEKGRKSGDLLLPVLLFGWGKNPMTRVKGAPAVAERLSLNAILSDKLLGSTFARLFRWTNT